MAEQGSQGIRGRITAQTEDALGKLAQDLLENPLVNGAISRAFDAREKASAAQEVAMGALNLPSAADLERLTRRLRSVSQRLEGIEDGVDRLERTLTQVSSDSGVDGRLTAIEEQLQSLTRSVADLGATSAPVPRAQERLAVDATQTEMPPAAGRGSRGTPRRAQTGASRGKAGRSAAKSGRPAAKSGRPAAKSS